MAETIDLCPGHENGRLVYVAQPPLSTEAGAARIAVLVLTVILVLALVVVALVVMDAAMVMACSTGPGAVGRGC